MKKELYIATNNGDIGGGEVMLLNIARAARNLWVQGHHCGPLGTEATHGSCRG